MIYIEPHYEHVLKSRYLKISKTNDADMNNYKK